MQYLKNIYAMFLGIKRCFSQKISYITKKNSSGCSFKLEIPTRVLYLITPLFLSPLMRLLLKTAFLLAPPVLNSWFKSPFESHSHDTRWVKLGYPKIPSPRTKTYEL